MVHTKHENKFKSLIDDEWSYLVYSGLMARSSKNRLGWLYRGLTKASFRNCQAKAVQGQYEGSWKKVQELFV